MYRLIAILLLLAHLGVLAAPVLAKAGPLVRSDAPHCAAHTDHAGPGVTQPSEDCDACDMPACPGMASCARIGVAIISMTSIDLTPAAELVSVPEASSEAANLLPTPLSPPPKP